VSDRRKHSAYPHERDLRQVRWSHEPVREAETPEMARTLTDESRERPLRDRETLEITTNTR
jgi:hypothetical protein